jgi:hypothetical protein
MRKCVAVVGLALALAMVPGSASAAPIGLNQCALESSGLVQCDVFADYSNNGPSSLAGLEGFGGYLPGYTFLLRHAANLADGFQEEDVAHILVIHDNLFELFSNTVFNLGFGDAFSSASTGGSIDGVSPDLGQLAGCPPTLSGVPNLAGVGYCLTADLITVYTNWGIGGDGGQDIVRIFTALPEEENPPPGGGGDPAPVPEPATISLFALGGSAALASIRRRRRAALQS